MEEKKKLKSFNYAVGMFGTSIPINMFRTFAMVFYVDTLGLVNMEQFALITAAYVFLDAIDNPIYGYLSDRTRTKWGRRKPWLVIGAPMLVLFYILFFNPPKALQPGTAFSYVILMYFLTGTLDSLINSNYGALFPELFPNEKDRARTNVLRHIFELLAMGISIALTPMVTSAIGYANTSYIYGALALVVILYMALTSKENPQVQEEDKPKLLGTVKDIIVNPKFWIYGVTNAAYSAGISLAQAVVALYVKYHLGLTSGTDSTIMLAIFLVTAIVAMPLWGKLIAKKTVMPVWRLAFACVAITVTPLYFTNNLVLSAIAIAVFGCSVSGVFASMDLIGAKILDDDAQRNGVRREGLFSSLQGILNKVSGLFTALAYFLVSRFFGYEDGNNVGSNPDMAARFLLVIFPFVLFAIAFGVSHFLRFKDEGKLFTKKENK